MNVPDQTAATLQVTGELVDELGVARFSLGARGLLMCLCDRRRHGQEIAHVQRESLDQNVLVPVQFVELPGEPVQTPRQRGFTLVGRIGRQERR